MDGKRLHIKVKSGREVRDLIGSEPFNTWYSRYQTVRQAIQAARDRHFEVEAESAMVTLRAEYSQRRADECLFRAGECEDLGELAHAEFAEIENTSFEMLSEFETERRRTTESWQATDRLEKSFEDEKQRLREMQARIDTVRESKASEAQAEADRLEGRARELEHSIHRTEKDVEAARAKQGTLEQHKDSLWVDVEDAWSRAFQANIARTEYAYEGRRARGEAESLFGQSTTERRRIDALHAEAVQVKQRIFELATELDKLLQTARDDFHCVLIEEFLFWPQKGNVATAWVVPLIDERHHLNIQVEALQLYQVERSKGLDFVEPVPEEGEAPPQDLRLDAFFAPVKHAAPLAKRSSKA